MTFDKDMRTGLIQQPRGLQRCFERVLKSRRDDLFIDQTFLGSFFLFFSGAGPGARICPGAFTRAAEKQKEKASGRSAIYKQVIPTGFDNNKRSIGFSQAPTHKIWVIATCERRAPTARTLWTLDFELWTVPP